MHFTYVEPNLKELKQGDILKKTPELLALIKEVHPHYAEDDYLYFQVLTQTCDLVRREGECKSRYITIAAVRKLDIVIQRAIEKYSDKLLFLDKLVCSTRHKHSLTELFNKLLNNNETNHFYLKSAPDFGLDTDCCTLLHLSISVRAYQHFDVCLAAKILELNENFRAKLGWLVGNLYSRIGTEDYVPGAIPDMKTYQEFVEARINDYVVWVPETDYSTFKKNSKTSHSFDEIKQKLEHEREKARDMRLNQIVSVVEKTLEIDGEQKKKIKNILGQHPLIQKVLNK
jgi:hypothetical protein